MIDCRTIFKDAVRVLKAMHCIYSSYNRQLIFDVSCRKRHHTFCTHMSAFFPFFSDMGGPESNLTK